ncbi:M48 family metallopeptidase, partial [Streptomyces sp. CA-249302]|uniref:M48 family metallopeptidase n=1 Tax=Streptomyces sp. CA-249302 TaxID=3240058 RepID=UPI003D8D118D
FMYRIGNLVAGAVRFLGVAVMKGSEQDRDDPVVGPLRLVFWIAFWCCWLLSFVLIKIWFGTAWLADRALTRQREWMADATAAQVTGKPLALEAALSKLEQAETGLGPAGGRLQSLCIAPARELRGRWRDLFSTHPASWRRAEQLRRFAQDTQGARLTHGTAGPVLACLCAVLVCGFFVAATVGGIIQNPDAASVASSQASSAPGAPTAADSRYGIVLAPTRPLTDDQVAAVAEQLRRRTADLGVKGARVEVRERQFSASASGDGGRRLVQPERLKKLASRAVLVFRPVIATEVSGGIETAIRSPSASAGAAGKAAGAVPSASGSASPWASSTEQGHAVTDDLTADSTPFAGASASASASPSAAGSPSGAASGRLVAQYAALDCTKPTQPRRDRR